MQRSRKLGYLLLFVVATQALAADRPYICQGASCDNVFYSNSTERARVDGATSRLQVDNITSLNGTGQPTFPVGAIVDGTTDVTQFTIQSHSTQSTSKTPFIVERSDGTNIFEVIDDTSGSRRYSKTSNGTATPTEASFPIGAFTAIGVSQHEGGFTSHRDGDNGGQFVGVNTGGTFASRTVPANGAAIVQFRGYSWDGNTYELNGLISMESDGTSGDGDVPSKMGFHTVADGTTTLLNRFGISQNGTITIGTASAATSGAGNHLINGTLNSAATSSSDAANRFMINANAYESSGLTPSRTSTTPGGALITLTGRTTDTASAIIFQVNQAGDSATAASDHAMVIAQNQHVGIPSVHATALLSVTQATSQRQAIRASGTINANEEGVLQVVNGTATASATSVVGQFYFGGLNDATSSQYIRFRDNDTNPTGSISAANATTVAFNTSSDRRLKHDIEDFDSGLETLDRLQPRRFRWNEDNSLDFGFIAQELDVVFPHAVTPGNDDGKGPLDDPQGGDVWMVDQAKLVVVLTAAIKELHAEVKAQREEIEQLKAAKD